MKILRSLWVVAIRGHHQIGPRPNSVLCRFRFRLLHIFKVVILKKEDLGHGDVLLCMSSVTFLDTQFVTYNCAIRKGYLSFTEAHMARGGKKNTLLF